MVKTKTILDKYIRLSKAVTEAEKNGCLVEEQKAMDRFWAFVNKYMYEIEINLIRETDKTHNLDFIAFE